MLKRSLMVFTALIVLLAAALSMSLPVAMAIGEVTATPSPAPVEPTATFTPASLNPAPTATPASLNPAPTATAETFNPPDANSEPLPELSPEVQDLMDKALEALQNGDYQSVVDTMTQALELEARNANGYVLRGVAYVQLKDFSHAVDDFTRAINLIPYSGQFYLFRANAYVSLNDSGNAMLDLNRAIDLDPRAADAFGTRAALNNVLGKTAEAAIDTLMAQGLSSMNQQDFQGAIEQFDQAIEKDGSKTHTSAAAYYNRGLANITIGNEDASIKDFTAALEIYPDMHDAYLGRGIAYRAKNDLPHTGADFLRRMEILEQNSSTAALKMGESADVAMHYGSVYRFTFDAHGGDTVAVEARATDNSGVDALLVVLDPSGVAIAGDDDTGAGISALDSLVDNLRLPVDGTYTIVVSHANGGFDGNVRVKVSNNARSS